MTGEPIVVIESLGGNCPVQGDGTVTVDGVEHIWYFRARGESWEVNVWASGVTFKATGSLLFRDLPDEAEQWSIGAPWPAGSFLAGWMTNETAEALVRAALKIFAVSISAGAKQDADDASRAEARALLGKAGVPKAGG